MKVKCDYITNSSSASFILYITHKGDIDKVKGDLVELVKEFWGHRHYNDEKNWYYTSLIVMIDSIIKEEDGRYSIEDWTAMLNYVEEDCPKFFVWLILCSAMDSVLNKYGIEDVKLKIKQDQDHGEFGVEVE